MLDGSISYGLIPPSTVVAPEPHTSHSGSSCSPHQVKKSVAAKRMRTSVVGAVLPEMAGEGQQCMLRSDLTRVRMLSLQ